MEFDGVNELLQKIMFQEEMSCKVSVSNPSNKKFTSRIFASPWMDSGYGLSIFEGYLSDIEDHILLLTGQEI